MTLHNKLTLFLLLFPFISLAHGEEVLFWFGVDFILFVAEIIFIAVVKLRPAHKYILGGVFLASQFIVHLISFNLSYRHHSVMINLVTSLVPLISITIVVVLLRKRSRRKKI